MKKVPCPKLRSNTTVASNLNIVPKSEDGLLLLLLLQKREKFLNCA